ncbi:cysteine protease ATG4B-like isoform X4 [Sitodiplosis mosellana]|uniref:cysteine protease ATG4B-like isoform X4 n=1 Tax=Sitodiplosis mosellana TaxID=263140 RepID=UPI00244526A5|nr:cysteine protease ATG4B-like isoform X4 [Sitodiplosis mosellana]
MILNEIFAKIRRMDLYLAQDSNIIETDDIPRETRDPVWVLGRRYNAIQELDLIRRDVATRLWCTYRKGFVPLGRPQLTSDKGWGCMLRCGQMLLGQALLDLHLGRDWFWTPETRDPTYLKIDSRKSPFSIHQIALMGDSEDKRVGEWFGPNTIAQVLKKLVKYDDWCSINIFVALDNCVVIEEIRKLCEKDDNTWVPLLLIIPLRLGLSEVNPIYIDRLKKSFEIPGTCGLIGGRPNQAHYFIGYVGDEALYLDPHTTQKCGSVGEKMSQNEIDMDSSYHQKFAARIHFERMDPSLAISFLCRTRTEFDELCTRLKLDICGGSQPLFEITDMNQMPWRKMPGLPKNEFIVPGHNMHDSEEDEFEFI